MLPMKRILIALSAIVLVSARASAQSSGLCRAADQVTDRIIARAKEISHGTDSDADNDRALFGIPPLVADTAITVIADTTLCARLVQARDEDFIAAGGSAQQTLPIYAIRFGPVYIVYDPNPDLTAGEFKSVYVYDAAFMPKGGWTSP